MHELGIVFSIIKSVKEVALENGATHVNSVTLDVGEVSLIIPSYLEDCRNWACKKEEIMDGCKLICNIIKGVTYCNHCKKTYETVKYGKTCPYCKSCDTFLQEGSEVEIKEISVDTGDEK